MWCTPAVWSSSVVGASVVVVGGARRGRRGVDVVEVVVDVLDDVGGTVVDVVVVVAGVVVVVVVMVVVVVVVGAGPKRSTSSGRSVAFSRLWNCCSLLPWFSVASRIWKPNSWPASYAACSCAVTFHVRQPVPEGDVANVPLLPAGCPS